MKIKLEQFIIDHFPVLGSVRRLLYALTDTLFTRASYSQHKEDVFIARLLEEQGVTRGTYVDVGANHPTTLSNTYLLYRKGFRGIAIEPNSKLCRLFRRFRKGDTVLEVGCSDQNAMAAFYVSKTPVLSSFAKDQKFHSNRNFHSRQYVPLLTLDNCLKLFDLDVIHFLSIDVEELNLDVLKGAKDTLSKAQIICIEFDSPDELQTQKTLLPDHDLIEISVCNAIYCHKTFRRSRNI